MKSLRIEFEKEMSVIPDWILGTSTIHHSLWMSMMDCNDILLILVVDRILKVSSIEKISRKFDEYVIETLNISPIDSLKVAIYFTAMVDYLLERCIEEEEYEAATNIRNFKETYFENMTTYNDDEE